MPIGIDIVIEFEEDRSSIQCARALIRNYLFSEHHFNLYCGHDVNVRHHYSTDL